MAERFYINCPLQAGSVVLQGAEAHHLAVVCRLRPGDNVCLFNGDGQEYPARIISANKKSVSLEVEKVVAVNRELPFLLEVAAPLPKGDRAQFLVEKLTELGVTTFVPLRSRRSVVHPRETKLEKLERYVIEASKQCGRNVLMNVASLTDWENYCGQANTGKLRLLAHPRRDEQTSLSLSPTSFPNSSLGIRLENVIVAVGPEGGFTDEEVALAEQTGWQVIDMGPRILRVETAALVLAAWVMQLHQ